MRVAILVIVTLVVGNLQAVDIYFKNGASAINVEKVRRDGNYWILIFRNGREIKVDRESIERVDDVPFDPSKQSKLKGELPRLGQYKNGQPDFTSKSNNNRQYLFAVSALSAVIAWDYFKQADHLDNLDFLLRSLGAESTGIQSEITRKRIVGGIAVVAAVVSVAYALKGDKVAVSTTGNSIAFNFRF